MLGRRIIGNLLAVGLLAGYACAQQATADRAARLRAQLTEIQAQETEVQTRLAQIDEAIKPENIERSLAGIGSTRPEELREARRRQLELQRKGLQSQLDSLAATRTRLENAIASAEAESYRQTVGPHTTSIPTPGVRTTKNSHRQKHRLKRRRSRR
jgi:hypothetical protein